jgi:drug/metabolite transporter (DMT)-like permease
MPKTKSNISLGYAAGLGYCVMTALSTISIAQVVRFIDPIVSTFMTFFITLCFFHLARFRSLSPLYRTGWQFKKGWLEINLWTALTWIGTFYGLKYMDAVLFLTLFMGLIPSFTYFISLAKGQAVYQPIRLGFALLILALIVCLSFFSGKIYHTSLLDYFLGVLYAIISVTGAALYLIQSKRFQQQTALSAADLLALRFWGLLLICLVWICLRGHLHEFPELPYFHFIYLAVITAILPLYLMQTSLHRLGALNLSFIMPFIPVLTYILLLLLGQAFHASILITLLILSAVLIAQTAYTHRNILAKSFGKVL